MKRLLVKSEVDQQVAEMWENVGQMSDEDNGKHEAVEEALQKQAKLYKDLDIQDKALTVLWDAAHRLNPESPMIAALSISANAERLAPILKSYQTT